MTALSAQNSALTQQISEREREIADAQTVAWLEQQARQLGYIFPEEQLYVISPPGEAHASTGGVSVPIPTFRPVTSPTPKPTPTPSPRGRRAPAPVTADAHANATPKPTPTPR